MNAGYNDSGHPLFTKLNILPLYSQLKFPLSPVVVRDKDAFKLNSAIHSINPR